METRECENRLCGKKFKPVRARQIYCSKKCRQQEAYYRLTNIEPPTEKSCECCTALFLPRRHNQMYCSDKCRREAFYERNKNNVVHDHKRCLQCENVYWRQKRESKIDFAARKHCGDCCKERRQAAKEKKYADMRAKRYGGIWQEFIMDDDYERKERVGCRMTHKRIVGNEEIEVWCENSNQKLQF